jgi:hypothetical protein
MNTGQLRRFVGNEDAYGIQLKDGSYRPVRKPLSDQVLRDHLDQKHTVGTYVNRGSWARFVVFDIDEDNELFAANIVAAAQELGVPASAIGVLTSGRKGFHVWILLQDWRPAEELRRFGRAVLAMAGVHCEVFPKQDEVRDLGNLVKLPLARHQVTGQTAKFLSPIPRPMPIKVWETQVLPALPAAAPRARLEPSDNRFPCMAAIQDGGASEGERNNSLFHLATMLRRAGATPETVELVLRHVNQKCEPPLDEVELQNLLTSSAHSGPICDQLPEEKQCGDLCIRARTSGLYTRPGQLRHAAVGENVVVTIGSRAGAVVTFEHDDLQTAKGALRN